MFRLSHRSLNLGVARSAGALPSGDRESICRCLCASPHCLDTHMHAGDAGPSTSSAAPSPSIEGPLETYTHAFWSCPAVHPAVTWLWRLWERLTGQAPPFNPEVLLTGDPSIWRPAGKAQRQLWLYLRAVFLHSIWKLRHKRSVTGQAFQSGAVVAATCSALEALIQTQFWLATHNVPRLAVVGREWFRGRRPPHRLAVERVWCLGGVLAHATPIGAPGPTAIFVHIPRVLP